MNKLESLLLEKEYLLQYLEENKKKINEQQIVREGYLINGLGFKKEKSEKDNTAVYTCNGYRLFLDLSKPNMVCFQKMTQLTIYGFIIETVEEFNNLLYFLSIK